MKDKSIDIEIMKPLRLQDIKIIRIFHLVPGMRLTVLFYAEDMSFVSRFIGPKTTFFSFSSFHSVSVASKGAKRIPLRLVNHVCIL